MSPESKGTMLHNFSESEPRFDWQGGALIRWIG
jgi:hypothetical protein